MHIETKKTLGHKKNFDINQKIARISKNSTNFVEKHSHVLFVHFGDCYNALSGTFLPVT